MKRMGRMGAELLLMFLAAGTASAQMGMRQGPPQIHGVWDPVVGSGGAYATMGEDGTTRSMEILVVGKETVDGKDAYWLEMVVSTPKMDGFIVFKNLMVLDGAETHTTRTIMQFPGRPPMEMPARMNRGSEMGQKADIRSDSEDLGKESITVPAGTFECEHYKAKDGTGDSWVTTQVKPYGLVKHVGPKSSMVLTKVITDGKDRITGTPVPFNPMMMQQQMPQPQE